VGFVTALPKPSRVQLDLTARGLLAENFTSESVGGNNTAPTSQRVFAHSFGLSGGDIVTGIVLGVPVAAAGTAPTTARFGLADSTGKILVLSGNLNAASNWTVGLTGFAFTAPYTVLSSGGYYGCFMVNGTWGTTQPTLAYFGGLSQVTGAFNSTMKRTVQWDGQTDLPSISSSLTLTSTAGSTFYMGLY
jgi:hypothetical protein